MEVEVVAKVDERSVLLNIFSVVINGVAGKSLFIVSVLIFMWLH